MKIYTRNGDEGESSLFGGRRVSKDDLRLEAFGTIDELNSVLGLVLCESITSQTKETLLWLQNTLFLAGADVAAPKESKFDSKNGSRIQPDAVLVIEKAIDSMESQLPELKNFILPGGNKAASLLHLARTVCRRAERKIVALKKSEQINADLLIFVNRISDLLFVAARFENFSSGIADSLWKK